MRWIYEQRELTRARNSSSSTLERTDTAQRRQAFVPSHTPGTDLALANGLLHLAIEHGLIDQDYIARRTEGFDELRRSVLTSDPPRVERLTGVPIELQLRAVRLLAASGSIVILWGRGLDAAVQGRHAGVRRSHQPDAGARQGRQTSERVWVPDRTGKWARGARARAEGGPAARVSPDREPAGPGGDCCTLGNGRRRPARKREERVRAPRLARTGRGDSRAPRLRLQRRRRFAERVPHREEAPAARSPRRLRHVPERDDGGGARGPPRGAVGGGRGDDDEPRRARAPAPARSPAPSGSVHRLEPRHLARSLAAWG